MSFRSTERQTPKTNELTAYVYGYIYSINLLRRKWHVKI
uniref:Uncharacterized protein n=1 Tax=Shigella sonnei TaxID=624 RepID=A0A0A0QVB5_SHISO|nr:Hypothetical protein [Shigella sonnei]